MAERLVYPGVFTKENDLSFLPQGIGNIGAAFIGSTVKGRAFVPTTVESWTDYLAHFGPTNKNTYLPYAVYNYIKDADRATIVRVLGLDGYDMDVVNVVADGKSVALLHPSYIVTNSGSVWEGSSLASNASGSAVITISGSANIDSDFTYTATAYSASIDPTSDNFLGKVFGKSAETTDPVYLYTLFETAASESLVNTPATTISLESSSFSNWNFGQEYLEAYTPYITSQQVGGNAVNLFRFATLSHGVHSNYELKIGIRDITPAGSVAGSEYGQFAVEVRGVDQDKIANSPFTYTDTDLRPLILESFTCNLDPDSPNYIGKVIGTKYEKVDSNGDIQHYGEYENRSKYIRVDIVDDVENKAVSVQLVPFGFRALKTPLPTAFTQPASASFVTAQTDAGTYNRNVYWGFDFDFDNTDNRNYLNPLPVSNVQSTGSNVDFLLSNYNQPTGAAYPSAASPYSGAINLDNSQTDEKTRKFMVPFQGGFDGWKPNLRKLTGDKITAANTQGFDISSATSDGYTGFKRAIDAIGNPEEYDINLMVIPGVLHELHSSVTNYAKTICEDRSDCFYIMDGFDIDSTVSGAISTIQTFDSNYVGTYYPWVKIDDPDTAKPTWVPPSVVMAGIYAYSDKVSDPWFAPAGLNRGGLTAARDVRKRLRADDIADLYKDRINPIKATTNQGIVVWGQKTLQGRPSALDRINVRRLLIEAKKYIASATNYLVFEQNTPQTRSRFLNIVNPYLERIRERQGLYTFRVVMDETNNTTDIIDRNMMIGDIYLQPTKTAEIISLNFNIQPTGAAFAE